MPAEIKNRYNLIPAGTPLALLEANGVLIVVPLVGDAHQVYAAHGETGLQQWVNQQAGLSLNNPPVSYTPPVKSVADLKLEAQERRMLLAHDLKMKRIAAQAQILHLRRQTAKERAESLLEAKATRNAKRYSPPELASPTADEISNFEKEQAEMLGRSELPQATVEG